MTRLLSMAAAAGVLLAGCATAPPPAEFGRLALVDVASRTVVYRLSRHFGGDAAVAAAREDGEIGPAEDLPNPIYIRDLKVDRRIEVSPTAVIRVLKFDAEGTPELAPVTSDEYLATLATGLFPEHWYGSPFYTFQLGPDGRITAIEHFYVP